jgi:hypothetical protein
VVSDEATADSFAALRNDKQKDRQRQVQVQKQIPSLRCAMTNKRAGDGRYKESRAQEQGLEGASPFSDGRHAVI